MGCGSDGQGQDLAALDAEFDEIEVPSLKQYRKLKRVMASITGFYENGTKKKLANYETMVANLASLDEDIRAARAQLAALEARSEFKGHPKVLQYREFIEGELETFEKARVTCCAKCLYSYLLPLGRAEEAVDGEQEEGVL